MVSARWVSSWNFKFNGIILCWHPLRQQLLYQKWCFPQMTELISKHSHNLLMYKLRSSTKTQSKTLNLFYVQLIYSFSHTQVSKFSSISCEILPSLYQIFTRTSCLNPLILTLNQWTFITRVGFSVLTRQSLVKVIDNKWQFDVQTCRNILKMTHYLKGSFSLTRSRVSSLKSLIKSKYFWMWC